MVDQMIRLRYSDMTVLKGELDRLFPGQQWSVDTEMGQYVLKIPRYLDEKEIGRIQKLQRHYQKQSLRSPR